MIGTLESGNSLRACFHAFVAIGIGTLMLGLISVFASAQAQEQFFTFKSAVPTPNGDWCIDIPGGNPQAGTRLAIANCTGAANQAFGYENGMNLTAGGLCVDRQPANAGNAFVLSEC